MTEVARDCAGVPGPEGFVARLPEVGAGDRRSVGGKGASLGEMCRAGVAIPPGFVVTTAAFSCALAEFDPAGEIAAEVERLGAADAGAIGSVTQRVRDEISRAPLPAELTAQIARCYAELCPGFQADTAVAVRSSATGEDSAAASFAGLQDTYLWVRGPGAVADRVRACWASLYNAEAVSYRRRFGIGEAGLAMAVVVQQMVDPRCAGVMFTCSPTTGDRSLIAVEATWGLGSALVSGDVTPDRFVVSKVTGEVMRRTVATKTQLHRMDDSGSGVAVGDVPAELREQPCLTDDEVRTLARLGRQVENHYGTPQDIEWAIASGDGSVLLLQSRPETYWAGRASQPVAAPLRSAIDHVFAGLSRPIHVGRPSSHPVQKVSDGPDQR
jgi:pyruvate, water dikinase